MSDLLENSSIKGVIDGFNHIPGVHCTSSAVRDVFEFHGFKMSEAMIFGLGSGMTLAYLNIPKMQPFFGGRNREFVKDLCSTLSVSVTDYKTKNESKGWHRLKRHLDNSIPSVIDIDMGFLKYQKTGLPSEDYHFGGHTIAVCGYDSNREIIYVVDTHFSAILEVSSEELTKGRNSTHDRFMAPNNRIYEFEFPEIIPELIKIIEDVLHRTGKYLLAKSGRMLRLVGINSGTTAIDVLIKDLDRWFKLPDKKLKSRCIQQAGYIGTKEHNYGTGGGLFRYLFSSFLAESAKKLNDESLHQLATFYTKLGEKWEKSAVLFNQIGTNLENHEQQSILHELKGLLSEIKSLEEEGANNLLSYSR